MGDEGFIRKSQLHKLFPVLGANAWAAAIERGDLPSKKISRKVVVVHRDDVIAFLRPAAATQTAATARLVTTP